ncbi:MAG: M20/M25/M40 family metallo-hydrolase [Gemmatimonadota bacterium]|nr:M20/M25/M40 family metallo-hydrolase [Gemmatimonadota bacterium]
MTGNGISALVALAAGVAGPLAARSVAAQDVPGDDPVLQAIWEAGTAASRVEALAQVLLDSLGPRLPGTPESEAALAWAERVYGSWDIDVRREPYGTWVGWRAGITHVDLLAPRVRTLNATMVAWSPGTSTPRTAPVIALPALSEEPDQEAFREAVRDRFVLLSPPEPTCRPSESWEEWAMPETVESWRTERAAAKTEFADRFAHAGMGLEQLASVLDEGGAAGILTSEWPDAWGGSRMHGPSLTRRAPHLALSCEHYGLLWRLAERGQGPMVRVDARAEFLGEVPVANLIGTIRGSELPDEYVILSAHFDSWRGASGATDNGAGTVVMMEAMRILREAYAQPKRTILVTHWNGEEQGLNGSRAFAADHPEIVEGLQLLLNLDLGTGRVTNISMMGLKEAAPFFERWLARIPGPLAADIELEDPGVPGRGSDYASFVCAGAPAFALGTRSWDYGTYTWHSTLDTFDKLVVDDLQRNATLVSMLAYLASEDPERLPRTRRVLPVDEQTGETASWPTCTDGARSSGR